MSTQTFMPHVAAVINPRAGKGRTGRAWRVIGTTLIEALGPLQPHFTTEPSTNTPPGTELARKALKQNAQLVIAVGGSMTIHEVVNGFFDNGALINPEAHLAILNTGLREGSLDHESAIAALTSGHIRTLNLGRATFNTAHGETHSYFSRTARLGKPVNSLSAFFCKPETIHLELDGTHLAETGKMHIAPGDDGFFRIARSGKNPELRAKSIKARADKNIAIELDDAVSGALPARLDCLEDTITLRC